MLAVRSAVGDVVGEASELKDREEYGNPRSSRTLSSSSGTPRSLNRAVLMSGPGEGPDAGLHGEVVGVATRRRR